MQLNWLQKSVTPGLRVKNAREQRGTHRCFQGYKRFKDLEDQTKTLRQCYTTTILSEKTRRVVWGLVFERSHSKHQTLCSRLKLQRGTAQRGIGYDWLTENVHSALYQVPQLPDLLDTSRSLSPTKYQACTCRNVLQVRIRKSHTSSDVSSDFTSTNIYYCDATAETPYYKWNVKCDVVFMCANP